MADKLIFDTNVPVTIALKFATGKRVESRYNDYEVFYSTTDGRCFYATPTLDSRIQALEPAAGEEFTVCKREVREGNKKRVEWQVTRSIDANEPGPNEPITTPPAPVVAKPSANITDANRQHSAPSLSMTQILSGALISSIDALIVARDYAASKGIEVDLRLDFNGEDARTLSSTAIIQYFKDAERFRVNAATPSVQRVNGGVQ